MALITCMHEWLREDTEFSSSRHRLPCPSLSLYTLINQVFKLAAC